MRELSGGVAFMKKLVCRSASAFAVYLVPVSLLPCMGNTPAHSSYALDASAHTILTDGVRASSSADDPAWLKLHADSLVLPKTAYAPDEFAFWGVNAAHVWTPSSHPQQFQRLKEANIKGIRYDVLWAGIQSLGPNSILYNWNGVDDNIKLFTDNGFSVACVLSFTPAWANGMRPRTFPPNLPVEQELVALDGNEVQLEHPAIIMAEQDQMPLVISPANFTTTRYSDEVIHTNFSRAQQPRAANNPVVVGTEEVWVNENDGRGWVKWTRVDNLINSPDGAEHYEFTRDGRVRFRDNAWYYYHGKTPANGSHVKISYDSINERYQHKFDYVIDNVNGVLSRMVNGYNTPVPDETFSSATLDPAWQWIDEPANWDVNTTTPGNLHIKSSATSELGHFIYQELDGSEGDFNIQVRLSKFATSGNSRIGLTVYKDENNWFTFSVQAFASRLILKQCINGVIKNSGLNGEFGSFVSMPRWLTVRKVGDEFTFYTSVSNPDIPEVWVERSFTQNLQMPLKVGISMSGTDTVGADIDRFVVRVPRIAANEQLKVHYNYLYTKPYTDFAKQFVAKYKDRVKYWEIYNEPDQGWQWRGGQEIYSLLLRDASIAIKEVDPEAQVMNGGYSDSATPQLQRIYDTIGYSHFDYVAWHPYLFSNISPDASNWAFRPSNTAGRNIMIANGDEYKKAFFGELATGSGVTGQGGGMNDWRQAEYAFRLFLWSRKIGYVKAIQWWPAIDLQPVGVQEDGIHGMHEGLFYNNSAIPKPVYWLYHRTANNKGVMMDLGKYDANNNLIPASGKYPISRITLGAQNRASIQAVKVLMSLTNTDASSKPPFVAARHIGQANTQPFAITVNTMSPGLARETWNVVATSPLTFEVTGAVSGFQGMATVGVPFASMNGVALFTIPVGPKAYVPGDRFVFDTFVGDTPTQVAEWVNDGSTTGFGDIEILLNEPIDARYVSLHFVKANGAPYIKIDEVQVYDNTNTLVSLNKMYIVDGYQDEFEVPGVLVDSIASLKDLEPGTRIRLEGKALYLKKNQYAYISELNRIAGIRLEGTLAGSEGELVNVAGAVQVNEGGERYLAVSTMAPVGVGAVIPLITNNINLSSPMLTGLSVKTFGRVVAGSITETSFRISDGSPGGSLKVVTSEPVTVEAGDFVTVNGAAGFVNERVLFAGSVSGL